MYLAHATSYWQRLSTTRICIVSNVTLNITRTTNQGPEAVLRAAAEGVDTDRKRVLDARAHTH